MARPVFDWLLKARNSNKLPLAIILSVACGFASYCCLTPQSPMIDPTGSGVTVRILLDTAAVEEPLEFGVDGPYKIFRGEEPKPFTTPGCLYSGFRMKKGKVLFRNESGLQLNGRSIPGKIFHVVPEDDGTLVAKGKRYNGTFEIQVLDDGTLWLVNELDIERYLAGVLFKEMPRTFHDEALKAQAVAARTYALYRISTGSQVLTDDTRSQVYGGADAESARGTDLVAATRGEVLVYKDRLFPAFFSSTCGGVTARASDVFSGEVPPPIDKITPCPYCSDSPFYRWQAVFTVEEIRARFDLPVDLDSFEIGITAYGPARRAKEIAFLDGHGGILKRCTAASFRSTLNEGRSLDESILSTRIDRIVKEEGAFRVEGKGWGHGVGLCQYGAEGLAKKDRTYREILEHYYPGAAIASGYGGLR